MPLVHNDLRPAPFISGAPVQSAPTHAARPAANFSVAPNIPLPRGKNGALPTLALYNSFGKPDITLFGPGKQPKTKSEAIEKAMGGELCETCKNRKYKDGSDDPGVSFKSPAHIAPSNSAAVVAAHEREHVVNAFSEAQQEGGKVVFSSVRLFSSTCPECGRVYISGGVTETRTAEKSRTDVKLGDGLEGQYIDAAI